jgi:hypothetical protein
MVPAARAGPAANQAKATTTHPMHRDILDILMQYEAMIPPDSKAARDGSQTYSSKRIPQLAQ